MHPRIEILFYVMLSFKWLYHISHFDCCKNSLDLGIFIVSVNYGGQKKKKNCNHHLYTLSFLIVSIFSATTLAFIPFLMYKWFYSSESSQFDLFLFRLINSGWISGKDSSQRGCSGTGTSCPDKWSQYQAWWSSSSIWTTDSDIIWFLGGPVCSQDLNLIILMSTFQPGIFCI